MSRGTVSYRTIAGYAAAAFVTFSLVVFTPAIVLLLLNLAS
jgi:hypothetical protein